MYATRLHSNNVVVHTLDMREYLIDFMNSQTAALFALDTQKKRPGRHGIIVVTTPVGVDASRRRPALNQSILDLDFEFTLPHE